MERKRLTNKERKKLVALYKKGYTISGAAAHVGCSERSARLTLGEEGIAITSGHKRRRNRHVSEKTRDEIVRLYKQRVGPAEITRRLNLHDPTFIYAVLKQRGVQPHSTHGSSRPDGFETTNRDGYVTVKVAADWPYLGSMPGYGATGRWILKHRKVMAEHLGRALESYEEVHHKDGNRTNNELPNLQVRLSAHGSGQALRCRCCGSTDLEAVEI